MPVGVETLPPLEVVLEEVEVVAGFGRLVDGLVPRPVGRETDVDGRLVDGLVPRPVGRETDVDGRLVDGLVPRPVGRETDVDGRLVDGLVPRPVGRETDVDGRLVDGLVPRLLEEVVVGGRLTVIFPAGLLTDMLPFD